MESDERINQLELAVENLTRQMIYYHICAKVSSKVLGEILIESPDHAVELNARRELLIQEEFQHYEDDDPAVAAWLAAIHPTNAKSNDLLRERKE